MGLEERNNFSFMTFLEIWYLLKKNQKNRGSICFERIIICISPNILKLISRPINIGCKSSNFVITMRRVWYYNESDSSEHDNEEYRYQFDTLVKRSTQEFLAQGNYTCCPVGSNPRHFMPADKSQMLDYLHLLWRDGDITHW